jgi:ADP-heptose:LPS heptosyltransferase
MPGSKWVGKKWPVENFAELLVRLPVVPVVMGTPSDVESVQLVERLKEKGVPVVSAVGTWSLREVARILAGAWRYLGNDTGLGHLAEAVGVPSFVVFGPTRADMGFGPWRPESRSISRNLACSPCGKDGRFCFRFDQRYACLRGLRAEDVMKEIPEVLAKSKQEIHG